MIPLTSLDLANPTNPANYVDRYGGALPGSPLNWRDDVSGQMQETILSYLEQRSTPEQLKTLIAYLQHYIYAPCWLEQNPFGEVDEEIAAAIRKLREQAKRMVTLHEVNDFINEMINIGLDPL
ncbi:MAG: hypothetical protein R2932_59165 [Caldilineaceae bacterium]